KLAQGAGKGVGAWAGRKGVRTAGWFAHSSKRMDGWKESDKGYKKFIGTYASKIQGRLSSTKFGKKLGEAYRKPEGHRNIGQSIWGGIRDGSGLFKKKYKTEAEKKSTMSKKQKALEDLAEATKDEIGVEEKPKEEKT
ncbi:MAG: hypothetical protein AAB958_01480, partial [Patescibacteria group bacterium]